MLPPFPPFLTPFGLPSWKPSSTTLNVNNSLSIEEMPYTEHTNPDTTAAFDAVAPLYDVHFSSRFDRAEEEVIADRFFHLLQRADVLDIGCGTGLVKKLADRLLFRPRSYTGVDLSGEMLEQALTRYGKQRSDIYETPFRFVKDDMVQYMWSQPRESVDVITSMYLPMNYTEHAPRHVYNAALNVLRPGGHFINIMASSRYVARKSHIVSAGNMRRFFEPTPHYLNEIPAGFKVVAIVGFNYFIERYRFWLGLCPSVVCKAMFRFDQIRGEKSGMKPYFYGIHLQKLAPHEIESPLGM